MFRLCLIVRPSARVSASAICHPLAPTCVGHSRVRPPVSLGPVGSGLPFSWGGSVPCLRSALPLRDLSPGPTAWPGVVRWGWNPIRTVFSI